MYISKELKEKNIAEYLLYMWQVEDMVRANELSIEKIKKQIIEPYKLSPEKKDELIDWYSGIINMMYAEGVAENGHLQINKNIILILTDLHSRLLTSAKAPFYNAAYYNALPFIVEFRNKSNGQDKNEIENSFEALYAIWMLKIQKKEVGKETEKAVSEIGKMISMLAVYYKEEKEGTLEL